MEESGKLFLNKSFNPLPHKKTFCYNLNMNLDQYTVILSIALLGLTIATLASILAFLFSPQAREWFKKQDYFSYIKLIGLFAIIATFGALFYQFYYKTPVCEYCWWQRIFMFPIDIVVLVSIWKQIKQNEIIIAILAIIGAIFAAVHYYFHVQVQIMGNLLTLPCSTIGIIPSCTETPVLAWGFVTIPLMALIVFLVIIWISFLAHYSTGKTS